MEKFSKSVECFLQEHVSCKKNSQVRYKRSILKVSIFLKILKKVLRKKYNIEKKSIRQNIHKCKIVFQETEIIESIKMRKTETSVDLGI